MNNNKTIQRIFAPSDPWLQISEQIRNVFVDCGMPEQADAAFRYFNKDYLNLLSRPIKIGD
jgi:hypothetical protein